MQVEYTGRQVAVTAAHRRLGDEGIERIVKLLPKAVAAHIVLTTEKYRKTADVTVKMRAGKIVGFGESNNMDTALREALAKAETQAVRWRKRWNSIKRQPKDEKLPHEVLPVRARRASRTRIEEPEGDVAVAVAKTNGKRAASTVVPVTVHTFPAKSPIPEPHIVRSADSVAMRPMTVEEAVKEAEFRDRDVFVFRNHSGTVCVLHRKRDGKMELIEAP
ncbi:MAG TPA: ribosome-associated translation inhibitor RaiA [Acidobacteriaceae bacterium]|jgi:ribosome hibernation promoting factor|nr:ribosome-associated translation inhibitor RaiA [Acidobacteriaceae bacterium]